MKKSIILTFTILVVTFVGCNKIEDPFPSNVGQSINYQGVEYIVDQSFGVGNVNELLSLLGSADQWTSKTAPDNSNQRFVVLEEFTGHTCTFCPVGTREIVRLDDDFGDTLIPIGIHAGDFADTKTGTKFTTDFRPEGGHGERYLELFNVSGYASGIVSRINQNASGWPTWEADIIANKNQPNVAALQMTNYASTTDQAIRSDITIQWKENLSQEYNLQLFLLEDNIVDWQLDLGVEKRDYNHRHVLRKVINDTFGKQLDTPQKDSTLRIQYIFDYDSNWKVEDLEVVAFIFERDQSSLDIIQANAAKVK